MTDWRQREQRERVRYGSLKGGKEREAEARTRGGFVLSQSKVTLLGRKKGGKRRRTYAAFSPFLVFGVASVREVATTNNQEKGTSKE